LESIAFLIKTGEIEDPSLLGKKKQSSNSRNSKLDPILNNTNRRKFKKERKIRNGLKTGKGKNN